MEEPDIPAGTEVVTYCWGPGCNGSTRAALELARLGYPVKEIIGGFEYWAREGLAIETDAGHAHLARDPLTGPVPGDDPLTSAGGSTDRGHSFESGELAFLGCDC